MYDGGAGVPTPWHSFICDSSSTAYTTRNPQEVERAQPPNPWSIYTSSRVPAERWLRIQKQKNNGFAGRLDHLLFQSLAERLSRRDATKLPCRSVRGRFLQISSTDETRKTNGQRNNASSRAARCFAFPLLVRRRIQLPLEEKIFRVRPSRLRAGPSHRRAVSGLARAPGLSRNNRGHARG